MPPAACLSTATERPRASIQEDKKKKMERLPNDPMILFSAVNMLLRDDYNSLDALCDDLDVDRRQLEAKLAAVGFAYSVENNKFW